MFACLTKTFLSFSEALKDLGGKRSVVNIYDVMCVCTYRYVSVRACPCVRFSECVFSDTYKYVFSCSPLLVWFKGSHMGLRCWCCASLTGLLDSTLAKTSARSVIQILPRPFRPLRSSKAVRPDMSSPQNYMT